MKGARKKYEDLLAYFCEDPALDPQQFFSTLHSFVSTFAETKKRLARIAAAERRRQQAKDMRRAPSQAGGVIVGQGGLDLTKHKP